MHAFKGGFTQNIIENGEIKIKNGLAEALLFDVNTAETKWSDINEGFERALLHKPSIKSLFSNIISK